MKNKLFAIGAFLLIMTAPVLAQQTYADYNHSTDFTQFHTYAWGQGPNPNQIANSFLAQTAQSAVNTQLHAKGLTLVQESQNPDLIVIGSGGLKQQTTYNAWGTGGWRFGGGMATVTPDTSVIGTMVIDIYNAKGKVLVWRGMASNTLNESNSSKNNQIVTKAVQKLFKQYP
jgi:Domain of unknown function (DUF4136)